MIRLSTESCCSCTITGWLYTIGQFPVAHVCWQCCTHLAERARFGLSCVRVPWQCLQGLLTADAMLADGFKRTRFLVLDEADRLLEPTFQVRTCTECMGLGFWVRTRQTVWWSPPSRCATSSPVFTGILDNESLSQWSSTAADDMPSAMPTLWGCQ